MSGNPIRIQHRIKILLIEDNPGDVRLINEMFFKAKRMDGSRKLYELESVDKLSKGLQRLTNDDFEVVLLDLNLPDSNGLNTFYALNDEHPEMPIVILTGLEDEGTALKAISVGAQDYLVKGQIDYKLLLRAIHYAIERKKLLIEEDAKKARERGLGIWRI